MRRYCSLFERLLPDGIRLRLFLACVGFHVLGIPAGFSADEKPFGIEQRVPWTVSRVVGRPDPSPPYTVEKMFTQLEWKALLYVAPEPGSDRLLVVEQGGERDRPSKIFRIRNSSNTEDKETFLEIPERLVYGVTFHPQFRTNGYIYVFSNGRSGQGNGTNRVARFVMDRDPPYRCDPESETVILEWRSGGHDGGDLAFGHDGMLYITSGDGTSDSDAWVSGQNVSNLLAALLRIDVDHPDPGRQYSIPPDNPFVHLDGARPEIWAYGFRNPWRMTVDKETGAIWVGNNGQDLWETAHRVLPGENYGWSVYEGSHPFYLNRKRGPTPIVQPTIEHSHADFRSLTGGVVYYGSKLPNLNGVYVYGDYSTGKIWGARHNGTELTWHRELADSSLQIASFTVDHNGDLLIVDHGDSIYRLVPSPEDHSWTNFPTRLSETGLFESVSKHQPHVGLIPYSVNVPGWVDSGRPERFIAVPDEGKVVFTRNGGWNFPEGTVLVQTLSVESEGERKEPWRRVETRLLTRQQGEWAAYTYLWNEDQSDATLVGAQGDTIDLFTTDQDISNGEGKRPWRVPSRTECMVCHSRAANYVLGLTTLQMNKDHDYGEVRDNQLRALEHIDVFKEALPRSSDRLSRLVNPYDVTQDLDARARSYLHANCSVCHVEAGGGNSQMQLQFSTSRRRMNLFEARPQHDTFGIANAMLIAPGDPERSVLYQRISRRGRGQMPPLVTSQVDKEAVKLFSDWIAQMKSEKEFVRDWQVEDLESELNRLSTGRTFASGRAAFRETGCIECHRFDEEGGSVGPDLAGLGQRLKPHDVLESTLLPSKTLTQGYETLEIETIDGELITGRLEREEEQYLVISPSVVIGQVLEVQKSNILDRRIAKTSNMPEGMLNTLDMNQILDLMAYLLSDAKEDDAMFR